MLAASAGTALTLSTTACSLLPMRATPDPLQFDTSRYVSQAISVDGQTLTVRAYEGLVYVREPVDRSVQVMNVYIPEAYFRGESVKGYTAATAPIFLPNQVGGYMPAQPGTAQAAKAGPNAGRTSTIAVALSKGFVVASPGARGRTSRNGEGGPYTGKAPAAIVDLKAAVRYLRHNDALMPGNAERIVSNGTSAGGALSALLGASGNHADYEGALKALGAAPERDDIFAVSAYCPITNLENADAAYEWQFNGVNDYRKVEISMLDYNVQRREVTGTLGAAQIALSGELKAGFPAYLNSLGLRDARGQALTLDAAGQGSFKDAVAALVMASAQTALASGQALSQYPWLRIEAGRVSGLDFDAYVRHMGRMKLPPAFDALDGSSGENQLFGTARVDKRHFTAFASLRSTQTDLGLADAQTVKQMNAMRYLGDAGARTATHWRLRHGTIDRDTSLAVPVMLATRLQNLGHSVDLALPWDRPHSGDYDLDELFAWVRLVAPPQR